MVNDLRFSKKYTPVLFFLILLGSFTASAQYVSPFVYENGTFRNKTRPEISVEESNYNKNKTSSPSAFMKPSKGPNSSGEIWIDGYCRYRPPSSKAQRFYDISEIEYLRPVYPSEVVRYTDDFAGKGNITWARCTNGKYYTEDPEYKNLISQVASSLNEGVPLPLFQQLYKLSAFSNATEPLGKYQFSRGIKVWIKRISGPEKMSLEFDAEYSFCSSKDRTIFKINDNGSYEIKDNCENCKSTRHDLKSGKVKSWKEGEWNEVGISKNEFNTVSIRVNGEEVFQYQIPDVPVATRFSRFTIELPYEWEKKKLMYHVGAVTIEDYPLESK